ncbi:MAG: Xaa-Pro dipeptidase, partial [Rhodospirillaceae bacterium]|nr:Xaa-Pro dipeptidase [Rhodospirillaceae bacterium]
MSDPRWVGRMPINHLTDVESIPDMARLRGYRLQRVREQLKRHDLAACVLFDPVNIRYATGAREFPVFSMHIWGSYVFIPADGPVIFFAAKTTRGIGLETISEYRPYIDFSYFLAGEARDNNFKQFAHQIAEVMREHCGTEKRIAVDRADYYAVTALHEKGFRVEDAQKPMERARAIKSAEEIACMTFSIATAEVGIARMREALRPGMTENQLWSILHQTNIAMGGEWIEARLMASGDRINPWFQESSDRMIRAGELVAFDTDMVGPFSYCADISRTFYCGPGKPTPRQRDIYKLAYEEVHHNIELAQPGMSFREFSEKAWKQPENCIASRYMLVAHGIGLCDEYPGIYYPQDWKEKGYDG